MRETVSPPRAAPARPISLSAPLQSVPPRAVHLARRGFWRRMQPPAPSPFAGTEPLGPLGPAVALGTPSRRGVCSVGLSRSGPLAGRPPCCDAGVLCARPCGPPSRRSSQRGRQRYGDARTAGPGGALRLLLFSARRQNKTSPDPFAAIRLPIRRSTRFFCSPLLGRAAVPCMAMGLAMA